MRLKIRGRMLDLVQDDITRQDVDAVVNAANSRLAGGGGVDGAIHRAGGPAIIADTKRRYPNGCPTGSAVISTGGNLPAKYVIHAVGPVWSGGGYSEEELLRSAYRTSFQLATDNGCASIALPALSTGAYRYPFDEAARAAIETTADFLRELDEGAPLVLVRFVLFSADIRAAFERALDAVGKSI